MTVTESELDFGSCSRLSTGTHKTLTVTNSTNAKVTAFLVVPEWRGYGSQALTHKVFQVGPLHPRDPQRSVFLSHRLWLLAARHDNTQCTV